MTFDQFKKSGWSWILGASIAVAVGFHRNWDTLSIVILCFFAFTGFLRLIFPRIQPFMIRQGAIAFSKMSPEDRERELKRLPPDQRERLLKEIEKLSLK